MKTLKYVVLGLSVIVVSSVSSAKDLNHRLGVGYKNQLSNEVPSVGIQYYPVQDLAVGLAVGVESAPDTSKFGALASLRRIIFPEDNLNFYMGGGVAAISQKLGKNQNNDSGFEILGLLGAEFFLPGLENLGFLFEAGVGVVSLPSGVTFRTFGDSPLKAGMFFYF